MAKLSHPNVVSVYDVEDTPTGVVLVMEYVAGQTLGQWASAEPRRWTEVVDRFLAAGRGLAAAHAEGLIHRDFKPANVLVAASGAVKVTDFGLAKLAAAASGSSVGASLPSFDEAAKSAPDDSLDGRLTQADSILGTPRYMAPEQYLGEALTAHADQYAFCVALWEALVGEPPFRAPSYLELGRQKCFGAPEWPANGPALPRRIIDAMRRGLAPKPSDRWPSMEALLGVLAYDPAQQRSRWVRTFGGLGLLAAVGVGWQWWAAARVERCTGAVERLGSAWDDTRRAAAESAVLGVGADYAGRVWERTAAELDAYATAWTTMHTEACEATTLRGEQSAAVMDLRMVCLDRARVELDVTTTILADADAQVVQKAHELVAGLPPLSRCADVEALRAAVEPPRPEEAAAVEDIRTRLAEAKAMGRAGRHADARAAVEATKPSLATVEYGPVHTEVTLAEGSALEDVGEYQPAEAALRRALALAYAWRQWDEVARASHELMFVV